VKAAMHELKLIGNYVRLPLVPLSDALRQKMSDYIHQTL
jgi:dihydrodipicolinate synthase/N-acetylneuraminate lyase